MLRSGEVSLLADVTLLWAALRGLERGPDGRFPERQDDDPALPLARYLQAAAVREGLRQGVDVAVTTSQRGQATRWQDVAEETATPLAVKTIDPGEAVVRARLADAATGVLSGSCERAVGRWYR